MSDLLATSEQYKKEADNLLRETNLVEDLEKYGKVHFTGSYAGNLMMNGDIDITVVRPDPYTTTEVFEIFKDIYFKQKFRSYFLPTDWDDPRKGDEFPNGHYMGLKQKIDDDRWKLDIWFISEAEQEKRKDRFSIKNADLSNDQKELILFFKKYRNDNKLSIQSQWIYLAVIEGNCKTVEDLEKYLSKSL